MPSASIDGLTIHYDDRGGDGPPIVLAHGWGTNATTSWHETGWVDDLRATHRVLTYDVRGHGRSTKPTDPEAYRYQSMAGDVLAVLDHAGIDRAWVLGHSLGAFSLTALLGHHRDRLLGAVLLGIGDETLESIAFGARIADALRAPTADDVADPSAAMVRRWVDGEPTNDRLALAASAEVMWPDGFPRSIGGSGLAEVDVPVLVVNGEDDVPYVHTDEALVAAIAGAELVRIPGCDHVGEVTDPALRRVVLDWLRTRVRPDR